MRSPITDEELAQWAELRADDAGHLARELIGYRRSAARAATSAMVERVARAIYDILEGEVATADYKRQLAQWEQAKILSQSAIEAMRDPTDKMVSAGCYLFERSFRSAPEAPYAVSPADFWHAMLDAALNEQEAG